MSLESWLQKKNQNIRDMREEILLEAHGYSTGVGKNWWQRNYLKMFLWGFLGLSLVSCYLLGFLWPARIIGLMLIFKGVFVLWSLIKKLWVWIKKGYAMLKAYLALRKLSRQISALEKD